MIKLIAHAQCFGNCKIHVSVYPAYHEKCPKHGMPVFWKAEAAAKNKKKERGPGFTDLGLLMMQCLNS